MNSSTCQRFFRNVCYILYRPSHITDFNKYLLSIYYVQAEIQHPQKVFIVRGNERRETAFIMEEWRLPLAKGPEKTDIST